MPTLYSIPLLPLAIDLETREVLLQLNRANKKLAELKGIAQIIPNEGILISTLSLQEAKDSSSIENIVTTHDELYRAALDLKQIVSSSSTKEVLNYRQALQRGFDLVRQHKILRINDLIQIQEVLEGNKGGLRAVPGTKLKNTKGEVVYTPPQSAVEVRQLMENLELYINRGEQGELDPLIKMAVIHHQFESIHPFYDGNGRTGRILCILYLIISGVLDLPILYLSRYITQYKGEYYSLLQAVRDAGEDSHREAWIEWVLFMLRGVEQTATDAIRLVENIRNLMQEYKQLLRPKFGKAYKQELLNNLFFHPYTKTDFLAEEMQIERRTAAKYLEQMVDMGLLEKVKIWRTNYYINKALVSLFMQIPEGDVLPVDAVESVHQIIDTAQTWGSQG